MTNEIADLLTALHEGTMTLDQVAARFRERKWPRRRRPESTTFRQAAAAELEDSDPYVPGSYDDVIAAYDRKQITREQLLVLNEAVAEAQRAEDSGE